jgi:quinol monooxygenase YgiN
MKPKQEGSMPESRVRVIARFTVRKEEVERFKELGRELLVDPTQGEAGCIEYQLCQDLADPTRFAMVETWESEQALAVHLKQPHLAAALGKLGPMAAEPPTVQRMRAV